MAMTEDEKSEALRQALYAIEDAHDRLSAFELGEVDDSEAAHELAYWAKQSVAQAGERLRTALGLSNHHLTLVRPAPEIDDDLPF